MGHRLSKIYTRTGDNGTTGLADGSRVGKDSHRIRAVGELDELNSHIGVVIAMGPSPVERTCLENVQHRLFDIGGELAMPGAATVTDARVIELEGALDAFNRDLPPLKEFILPGGGDLAASCHVARSVCRRAERGLLTLAKTDEVNPASCRYLNRLSDLLFVMARRMARRSGGEVYWVSGR